MPFIWILSKNNKKTGLLPGFLVCILWKSLVYCRNSEIAEKKEEEKWIPRKS
jgi:hypothetical protein